MNGWSRRPVALRTVSYPHHREHPAVKHGRRGTHRAAQKGAQAQRAVVVDLDSLARLGILALGVNHSENLRKFE